MMNYLFYAFLSFSLFYSFPSTSTTCDHCVDSSTSCSIHPNWSSPRFSLDFSSFLCVFYFAKTFAPCQCKNHTDHKGSRRLERFGISAFLRVKRFVSPQFIITKSLLAFNLTIFIFYISFFLLFFSESSILSSLLAPVSWQQEPRVHYNLKWKLVTKIVFLFCSSPRA